VECLDCDIIVVVFNSGMEGCAALFVRRRTEMSFFDVPLAPPDPIFDLTTSYNKDTFSKKLNLGVGAYRTAEAQPYVLNVVKKVRYALFLLSEE
jgi:hypothetical protein